MDGLLPFLDDLPTVVRVVVTTALSYGYVVVLIRLSGKRTIAHMNSFDWIINVAVGALTASAILTPENTAEAWIAIGTVIALQWALTKLVQRFKPVARLVREEPRLLARHGVLMRDAMAELRVSEDSVMAALRGAGLLSVGEAEAIVFETDGRLSVIAASGEGRRGSSGDPEVLRSVDRLYTGLSHTAAE